MRLIEFRVLLPMTVEEYQVGQLYSVAEASKNETGGGDGIEVLINKAFDATITDPEILKLDPWHIPTKPFKDEENKLPCPLGAGNTTYTKGQYTEKIYRVEKKVPGWIGTLASGIAPGCLTFKEQAWNAYPYCRTVIDNSYMKKHFFLMIETMHVDNDNGSQPNIHNLSETQLREREVVLIDIANDKVRRSDYKASEDPANVRSEKANRGPLRTGEPKWYNDQTPLMCCYKLVSIHFKWWGVQTKTEAFLKKTEQRLFLNFHRQVYSWMDKWHGMTMQDIRELEDKTKEELDKQRLSGGVRGTSAATDE